VAVVVFDVGLIVGAWEMRDASKHRHAARRLLAQSGLDRGLWRSERSNTKATEISEDCGFGPALCRRIYLTNRECYYLQLHMSNALTDLSHLLHITCRYQLHSSARLV
jgi:hypothetical protein